MKLTLPIWSNLARGLLFAVILASALMHGEAWAAPKYATFLLNFQQIQPGVMTEAEVMPRDSTTAYIYPESTLPFVYDPARPTHIIIPAGVTHARLSGTVCWGNGAAGGDSYLIQILRNGYAVMVTSTEYPSGGFGRSHTRMSPQQ